MMEQDPVIRVRVAISPYLFPDLYEDLKNTPARFRQDVVLRHLLSRPNVLVPVGAHAEAAVGVVENADVPDTGGQGSAKNGAAILELFHDFEKNSH